LTNVAMARNEFSESLWLQIANGQHVAQHTYRGAELCIFLVHAAAPPRAALELARFISFEATFPLTTQHGSQ